MSTSARTLFMTLLVCLAPTPSLAAASGADVLRDCLAGHLQAHYPAADYASALSTMPADVKEYSDCSSQIQAAQLRDVASSARTAAASRVTTTGGSTGSGTAPITTAVPDAASRPIATTAPASTATTPSSTETPSASTDPTSAVNVLAALPAAGDDGPSAGAGHGLPAIPIVIAFAVIALSAARALQWWGDRPDTTDQTGSGTA